MKKLGYALLLSVACAGGCWSPFLVAPNGVKPDATRKAGASTRSARPVVVTPDQVKDGNAHEIVKAMEEELDRAEEK
jgi:hypothetical protein